VVDLSRVNNDMNNLLAGTGVATVFVDHQLRILRFTPAATRIINLIHSDVGRPVGHFVSNLVGYDQLVADVQGVLDTLVHREVVVATRDGGWYMLRIQPYRTMDNVIEGAVITFVDITEAKRTELAQRRSESMLRATQRLARTGSWEWSLRQGTLTWSEEMFRLHGIEATESGLVAPEVQARCLAGYKTEDQALLQAAFQRCLQEGTPYDLVCGFRSPQGQEMKVRTTAEPVREQGKVDRIIGFVMDISGHREQDL
jgi:two-component system CheB/CheR fusion protein